MCGIQYQHQIKCATKLDLTSQKCGARAREQIFGTREAIATIPQRAIACSRQQYRNTKKINLDSRPTTIAILDLLVPSQLATFTILQYITKTGGAYYHPDAAFGSCIISVYSRGICKFLANQLYYLSLAAVSVCIENPAR